MEKALALARKAYKADEIPIGALVVGPDDHILGRGYNRTEKSHSQSRHAEVVAIENAGKKLKDWRLEGCTVYVTLQPCLMCMSLISLSRIERVVYGAESPLFGYHLDKEVLPCLYRKHIRGITAGVLAKESRSLVERFFTYKRKKGEQFRND